MTCRTVQRLQFSQEPIVNMEMSIAPELPEYVSKEIEKDASVMKKVRKAREERVPELALGV